MPVEIKELIIRAVVTADQENSAVLPQTETRAEDREAIIQECVRQVLRILQKMKDR
jgi:hypothetical protein